MKMTNMSDGAVAITLRDGVTKHNLTIGEHNVEVHVIGSLSSGAGYTLCTGKIQFGVEQVEIPVVVDLLFTEVVGVTLPSKQPDSDYQSMLDNAKSLLGENFTVFNNVAMEAVLKTVVELHLTAK